MLEDNGIASDLSHFRFENGPSEFSIALPFPVEGIIVVCMDTVSSRILLAKLGSMFIRRIEIFTMILNVIFVILNQLFICHLIPNVLLTLILIKFHFKLLLKCQFFLFTYSATRLDSVSLS